MKNDDKNAIFLLFLILVLSECAPPPIQDKIYEIKVGIPKIISNKEILIYLIKKFQMNNLIFKSKILQ